MLFLSTYIEFRAVKFSRLLNSAGLVNSNFRRGSRMRGYFHFDTLY